jgi:hypothetical protein
VQFYFFLVLVAGVYRIALLGLRRPLLRLVEALVVSDNLYLRGGEEGWWKRGLGGGLANLLNQQGIHGVQLDLGLWN